MDLPEAVLRPEFAGRQFDIETLLKFLESHNATLSFREIPNVIEGAESPMKLMQIKIPAGAGDVRSQRVVDTRMADAANFPYRSLEAERLVKEIEKQFPRLRVR
jgi:hypothetical protein